MDTIIYDIDEFKKDGDFDAYEEYEEYAEEMCDQKELSKEEKEDAVDTSNLTGLTWYLSSLKQPLTTNEEIEMFNRILEGDHDAWEEFIERNLRLVIPIARYYKGPMELEDAIQEGNLGLIRAVDSFDPTKGFKFSTYATHWIRNYVERARSQKYAPIRIPCHFVEQMNNYRNYVRAYERRYGFEPSLSTIKKDLNLTDEQIKQIKLSLLTVASLDKEIDTEDSSGDTLASFIPSEGPLTEDLTIDREMADELITALGKLNAKEQTVINLRFGLDGRRRMTLEEIGQEFGCTREWIRQIENRAIKKLKNSSFHRKWCDDYVM